MPNRLLPQKFDIERCGPTCSLGSHVLGQERADLVHSWFELGYNNDRIQAEAEKIDPDWHFGLGSIARHRKNHLRVHTEYTPDTDTSELSDLELIRLFIKKGASQMSGWKIGPKDFMDAMQLFYKMTQGSAMQDFFATLSAAAAGDDDAVVLPDDPALVDPSLEDEKGL